MKTLSSLALVACFCLLWMSCSFSHSNSPDSTSLVKTTIAGQVVDESGNALAGAVVTAYGKSVTTTSIGTFMFSGIDVPAGRLIIKVTKSGYFPAFRAAEPMINGLTQLRCGLMASAATAAFSSTSGGTVNVAGGASISLPANGYVNASGSPYSGTVRVSARLLSPSTINFYDFFAGDFQAKCLDGSQATLLSNGVLRVELSDNTGNKLNLANGATAQLSAPVSAGMTATATIPLWYFDETIGMWKEEGSATKQGSNYVGSVQHFSDWNFDWKSDTSSLHIRVHCDEDNVPGVVVHIGQNTVVTDAHITNIRRVQSGVPIIIKVRPEDNSGLESAEQTIGPLVTGQSLDVDVPLIVCPAYISGTVVDCDNHPIDATIYGEYAQGGYFFGFASKGVFKVRTKSGSDLTVRAISPDGHESDNIAVIKLQSSEKRDVGNLVACSGNTVAFKDIDLNLSGSTFNDSRVFPMKLSHDGSTFYTFGVGGIKVWDVATASVRKTIPVTISSPDSVESLNFDLSDDESVILVPTSFSLWTTYDVNTGAILATFPTHNADGTHLSPDGNTVVTNEYTFNAGTQKGAYNIVVYNARSGQEVNRISSLNGKEIEVITSFSDFISNTQFGLVLGRDKQQVADNKMYVVSILDGSVANSFDVNGGIINGYSPDGKLVAVWNYLLNAAQYSFYDVTTGTKISTVMPQVLGYPQYPLAIHPDKQRFAAQAGTTHDSIAITGLFSIANGLLLKPMVTPITSTRMNTMSFSADGKYLAAVYCEVNAWKVRVWTL